MEIWYYPLGDSGYVREYFDGLRKDGQRKKAEARLRLDLLTLQDHWPDTLNVSVKILKGYEPLYELVREFQGIAYRVFFCVKGQRIWLLHAIEKKRMRTPQKDLRLAFKRLREVMYEEV